LLSCICSFSFFLLLSTFLRFHTTYRLDGGAHPHKGSLVYICTKIRPAPPLHSTYFLFFFFTHLPYLPPFSLPLSLRPIHTRQYVRLSLSSPFSSSLCGPGRGIGACCHFPLFFLKVLVCWVFSPLSPLFFSLSLCICVEFCFVFCSYMPAYV